MDALSCSQLLLSEIRCFIRKIECSIVGGDGLYRFKYLILERSNRNRLRFPRVLFV